MSEGKKTYTVSVKLTFFERIKALFTGKVTINSFASTQNPLWRDAERGLTLNLTKEPS